jgi:hypothetical protein
MTRPDSRVPSRADREDPVRRAGDRWVPAPVRVGLIVIAAGVLLDVIVHGAGPGSHDGAVLLAHVTTFAGMVVTLLGVFAAAITQRSRRWADERR